MKESEFWVYENINPYYSNENSNPSGNATLLHKFEADESVQWSMSGEDYSNFMIDGIGNLYFLGTSPDYENPKDNDSDNIYKFNVIAKDNAGNKSSQPIALTIKDEFEADKVAPIITVQPGGINNPPILGTFRGFLVVSLSLRLLKLRITVGFLFFRQMN